MRHPLLVQWEKTMKEMFDQVDDYIENKYGSLYPLHPNRPARGATGNKESDGLFNVGASFSAGYGTSIGRGYVLDIEMATLQTVEDDVRAKIEDDVVQKVRDLLPEFFPERKLEVTRDGRLFKIHGDFTLGPVHQ